MLESMFLFNASRSPTLFLKGDFLFILSTAFSGEASPNEIKVVVHLLDV